MSDQLYPSATLAATKQRSALAPKVNEAFRQFSQAVFDDGALDRKTKQLIAVAVAHVTQCAYCIRGHTKAAIREGASDEQIMEAIWVASEMRAGATYAHSLVALDTLNEMNAKSGNG